MILIFAFVFMKGIVTFVINIHLWLIFTGIFTFVIKGVFTFVVINVVLNIRH